MAEDVLDPRSSPDPLGDPSEEEFFVLPTSFAQQRMWFLERLTGGAVYTISRVLDLSGELDAGALERTFDALVSRHESLRTTFAVEDGVPVQVIAEKTHVCFEHLNLAALPALERRAAADERVTAEGRRVFDLEGGPLFRVVLLRLAQREHVLVITLHHIICDGWSMGILWREIAALYRGLVNAEPSPLPELPIQYADFAQWQREWLQGEALERQLSYWRTQLADAPTLELPTAGPRPAVQTFDGACEVVRVPHAVVESLHALSRDQGATLFMALFTGLQLLVHRYTGQSDIVIGTPIANRNRTEVEGLVGCLVNSLALRVDLSGDPTVRELLGRVREVAIAAYAQQDLPFEKLVEELELARDTSRNPLFQVILSLQNEPNQGLHLQDLRVTLRESEVTTTRLDIEFHLAEKPEGIEGFLVYNTGLFRASVMARMVEHFTALLSAMVTQPDVRISRLPLLLPGEERSLALEWNDTRTSYPRELRAHELFEVQVTRCPTASALRYGDDSLSYKELDTRANQVARALRARGVVRGDVVGLCVARSVEMLVAVLGILKAGAAYLPIDHEYPKSRIAFMIEDAGASLLLTQSAMLDALPEAVPCLRDPLCLDRDALEISEQSGESPRVPGTSEDLAYVIYTSGSTGEPKGTAIPHRAVARLVMETNYIDLGPEDRIAQVSNVSFDAATFEFYGALLCGGELVGFERELVLAPLDFAEALRRYEITTLFLTTALFNQVVREVPDAFVGLRYLLVGGEMADPGRMRDVLEKGAPRHFLHVYGPTECTTFAVAQLVEEVPFAATSVPIGFPIANTQCHVLDSWLAPVPLGVPGELYLAGDGLAVGYLGRPGMTAERFVPNPFVRFGGEPGSRLYRTGDRVRRNESGAIEFLGRVDHQVKLRGFRIELGEIESLLLQHESVVEAVAMVREDVPGTRRLVAYAVGSACDPATLRSHLDQQLPRYMVPSVVLCLPKLPLNSNGKLDRAALPAPEGRSGSAAGGYIAPRSEAEREIAAVWCSILGIQTVGRRDNFFDLGGNSLLLVQVLDQLRDRLGVDLAVMDLFRFKTVEALAQHLSHETGDAGSASVDEVLDEGPAVGRQRLVGLRDRAGTQGRAGARREHDG